MSKPNRVQLIKYAPPPPELPVFGKVKPEEVSFIGRTNYVAALEEKKYVFGIKRVDRKRHVYMIGKPGSGKTKALELLIRQDIAYGHGACVLDTDGELVESILDFIPESRKNDVCLIDPSDLKYPVAFNPLVGVDPVFRFQFTQSLIEAFAKQFGSSWSAKIEHVLRFSFLALLDYPEATLRGAISLLTDQDYREKVLPYIGDDMVRKFFSEDFIPWSQKNDSDVLAPIINKLSQFVSDPVLGKIFSQIENKVKITDLINQQKIILVNLAKGRIGEDHALFFGSVFLTALKQSGMERANFELKDRPDFYIYIDEFQNIATQTLENIISESRKYAFALTLTHQYLAQIPSKIHQTVLNNTGAVICFRVGGEDASKLKSEFDPVFGVKDMINLGVGEFYIKMTIDGESYDPFSAEELKVFDAPYPSNKELVINSSRALFSTSD